MHHRSRGLQRERNDAVRRRTAEIRKEADATGIVFFERIRLGSKRDGNAGVVRDSPTSL